MMSGHTPGPRERVGPLGRAKTERSSPACTHQDGCRGIKH